MAKKDKAWNSPSTPPPVGKAWMVLSDNVEVLLADDRIVLGFFEHEHGRWYNYLANARLIEADEVKGWRDLHAEQEGKR